MKQSPGCLGDVGDEILPSYVGITINHEVRDLYYNNQDLMERMESTPWKINMEPKTDGLEDHCPF